MFQVAYIVSVMDEMSWHPRMSNDWDELRPRQNARHFADDVLICIFMNENFGQIGLGDLSVGHPFHSVSRYEQGMDR